MIMQVELHNTTLLITLNRCIMGNFRKLLVWQKAMEIVVIIYKLVKTQAISKDFGFRDQIQRAAVSIPANIAEGDELDTDKQSVRHFYIAKGSSAELQTLLLIAQKINYMDSEIVVKLVNECKIVSVMLSKLISARS
jgi:four helix bundle protein